MTPRFRDPARLAGSRLLRLQSDERLVALSRDGHEAAFAAIVDRYRPALERYAERIVGRSRAEDAVQQAFVNAHHAMLRDDREIQLKAWLYRITHNAALNMLRTVHDEVELDDATYGPPATAMAASGAIEDVVELHARLRETLDTISSLPAPQRDALLLRELEGRSHDEIALALGITSGAARQHVMRARVALRAAASAVTPYPLISHLATSLSQSPTATATGAEILGGTGVGAIAIKLTAGFAATGALVSALAVPVIRSDAPTRGTPPAVAGQHDDAVRTGDPKPSVAIVHATRTASATAGRARGTPTTTRTGSAREDRDERDEREDEDEDRRASTHDGSGHDGGDDREDRRSGGDDNREADHESATDDDSLEHASSSGSGADSGSSDSSEPAEDPGVPGTDEAVPDAEPETRSGETTTTESHDDD